METIAVIGLGYVGLPLAVELGKKRDVIGFDINSKRIGELREGKDWTREVEPSDLKAASQLSFSENPEDLKNAQIFIVTVPTPIDAFKKPDLTPLIKSSETVGRALKKGDVVIYESTVYPGCTEEDCVPILEKMSGLKYNRDFFCGYSPERMNPGDKNHTVKSIVKVTSGSTPEVAQKVDELYAQIVTAGTYKASSIKVAEAAKVIENTQRDINIAFVNELAILFNKMDLDTTEVLEAAGTKWNFLPFRPGLVGGHCIGVDPYYLTHKAESIGHHPQMILAGRRINDGMGSYVAGEVVKLMIKKGQTIQGAKVLMLGITFKENCPDIRNSRAIDIVRELKEFGCEVDVCDPWANAEEVKQEYGLDLINLENKEAHYDAAVVAVAHREFKELGESIKGFVNGHGVIFDLKSVFSREFSDQRL